MPKPIPTPADLHELVDKLAEALTAARAGNLSAYGEARDHARAIEVAGRRIDVDLADEAYTAQRKFAAANPRAKL